MSGKRIMCRLPTPCLNPLTPPHQLFDNILEHAMVLAFNLPLPNSLLPKHKVGGGGECGGVTVSVRQGAQMAHSSPCTFKTRRLCLSAAAPSPRASTRA